MKPSHTETTDSAHLHNTVPAPLQNTDPVMDRDAVTEKLEKRILWLSFLAGAGFAVYEFFCAIYLHSQSVLMDAAYDSSELIVIIFTLFLTPLFHKPLTEKHPYGYLQVESIVVIIKGFMLLSVSIGLSVNSINIALAGGGHVDSGKISLIQFVMAFISLGIYLIMSHMNRHLSSPTVKAELLGWKLDISYSLGLSLAFFGSTFLSKTPLAFLAPYFDQIVAVIIVFSMMPENLKMLWRAIKDVFLFSPEEGIVEEAKEICGRILEDYEFEPVFYDITRTGRQLWFSVYFRISEDTLSMKKLNAASYRVRTALEERFEDCSSELIVVSKDKDSALRSHVLPEDLN